MTDRVKGFTVTLERDVREDDVAPLGAAIRQLRGVVAVDKLVADPGDWTIRQRTILEIRQRLYEALKDVV